MLLDLLVTTCNGSISVNVEGGTSPYYWDGDQLGNFRLQILYH